jgi:Sulfatase/Putative metal-binding motif
LVALCVLKRSSPLYFSITVGWLGGLGVGVIDGVFAALQAHPSLWGLLASVALVAGLDALVGALFGLVLGILVPLRRWGQAVQPGQMAFVFGRLLAAVPAASFAAGAVFGTSNRVNRLLAGGVVSVATLGGWLLAFWLAPAASRVLSSRRAAAQARDDRATGAWLVPLMVTVAAAIPVLLLETTHAPLRRLALIERAAWAGALGLCVPLLCAAVSRGRWRAAFWFGGGGYVAVATVLIVWGGRHWESDLQFLPWNDLLLLLAVGVVAGTCVLRFADRSGRFVTALMLLAVSLGLVPLAAESESARKVATASAGLAGTVLTQVRRIGDWDRDGHPRFFGGGDCDDRNPQINPAALDWPQDGIDQDCDGQDAHRVSLEASAFHVVPAAVPTDLNVLLIAIDTLRADHLSCYGYARPTSPALDALAREGTLFENSWAHAPSTRYSMPAIFTGRWPSAVDWQPCTGCDSFWPRIGTGNVFLAEVLKPLGYRTGAFWAYAYFDARWQRGFERGVDVYDSQRAMLHQNIGGPAESQGTSAAPIADDGIAFLRAHAAGRFFLTLHFYDPHLNYETHPDTPSFGDTPTDRYDHEIRYTDTQIGRVFAELKMLGLWGKTAIVVTGDHGEGLGERAIAAHGYHLYPPQTKVPLIVRVPGLNPQRIMAPVSHVDLAPSIVNLARGPHQVSFQGRSFVDLLTGAPSATVPARKTVFQEVSYEGDNQKRALVSETHQLIWNWTPQNTTECYRLAEGLEAPDRYGEDSECDVLKQQLRTHLTALSLPPDFSERLAREVTAPGATAPPPANALDLKFGPDGMPPLVALTGYDLAGKPTRGQSVEIALHFKVLGAIPAGWKLFVHLQTPTGAFENLDHPPVGGALPVEQWVVGQSIRDRFALTPSPNQPAGPFTLWVGFWRGNERWAVVPPAADNRAQVAVFDVP